MAKSITAVSWNVHGEIGIGEPRLERQLTFLDRHTDDVDLFLLQAVNVESDAPDGWEGHLGALLDFFSKRDHHVAHTGDWARELTESTVQPHADIEGTHNRCNLTASRWPIERRPLSLRNRGDRKPRQLDYYYGHFPEKLLVTDIDIPSENRIDATTIEGWNVGIVNGANWGEEKLNMLETVYGRIYLQTSKTDTPVLLGGDFNAPKYESETGEITPHGKNTAAYMNYPYYGDPHHLRNDSGAFGEYSFDQRWQLAEERMFDPDVGDWGMRDVYWAADESQHESSTVDFTHVVHSASPSKKRLDHILVSEQFDVRRCDIWNGERTPVDGLQASDHAPIVTEVAIGT